MGNTKQSEFLKLYEPVHERFEKYCRARTYGGYPYEDLMNDCLLKAFDKLEDLEDPQAFLRFLIGISRRLLANASRKMKPEPMAESFQPAEAEEVESSMKVQFLHWCLSQLPESHREALVLYEIVGFSIKEMANSLSITEDNVKKRLSRGRQKLRK